MISPPIRNRLCVIFDIFPEKKAVLSLYIERDIFGGSLKLSLRLVRTFCVLLALTALTGCAKSPTAGLTLPSVPKGNRVLGMDFSDTTQTGTFSDNAAKAKSLGASSTSLSLQWNQIETSPSTFTDPGGALAAANAYYPANGFHLVLTLRAIDTVAVPVPADLAGVDFNQASVISRYTA